MIALQIKLGKGIVIMNKEEILCKARKENNGVDEVKRVVAREAATTSRVVGAFACLFFTFMDRLVFKTDLINHICWIIYGTMVTTDAWVYAVKLKKKGYWLLALLGTAGCAALITMLFSGR